MYKALLTSLVLYFCAVHCNAADIFVDQSDGNNDFWNINGVEQFPNNTVIIFNRWGDMVFKLNGYDNASNVFRGEGNQMTGMGAGQLLEGTYFFRLELPEQHNLKATEGFLVLKR